MSSLISLLIRGLSIYRWSNFSRIEQTTTLDHAAFSLQIAYLLADLMEESGSQKIDKLRLYEHSLFSTSFTCMYSDIGSEVKARIRSLRPDLYGILSDKVEQTLLAWNLPASLHASWQGWSDIHQNDNSLEQHIFEYAKIASAYFEATFNARVYPEMYGDPLAVIRKNLNMPQYARFRELLDVTQESEPVQYILTIRRLQSAYRWNRLRRTYPISVMAHLYLVAVFSYLLTQNHSHAEREEAILLALAHDIPEAITGDIITPTKKAAPWFEEVIAQIEENFVKDKILHSLQGRAFLEHYERRLLHPWDDVLGKRVKLADHFSAFTEARLEELANPNNEQFGRSREWVASKITQSNDPVAIHLMQDLFTGLKLFMPDSELKL